MFDSLFDIAGSVLTGGVTGLLGTIVSGIAGHFQAKQKHKQDLELKKVDLEQAKVISEGRVDAAAYQGLAASYQEASARFSRPGDSFLLVMVDIVRGLTRPVLTFGLAGLVGYIYITVGGASYARLELQDNIVETILFLTTAAVLWWFGSRQIERRHK